MSIWVSKEALGPQKCSLPSYKAPLIRVKLYLSIISYFVMLCSLNFSEHIIALFIIGPFPAIQLFSVMSFFVEYNFDMTKACSEIVTFWIKSFQTGKRKLSKYENM